MRGRLFQLWPSSGMRRSRWRSCRLRSRCACFPTSRAVIGAHGAGLVNGVFCRSGTPIVELADADFPNPEYYDMSSSIGHPYWVVFCRSHGLSRPGQHDLVADLAVLRRIARDVEERL